MKNYIGYLFCLALFLTACKKELSSTSKNVLLLNINKSQDTIGATVSIFGSNFDPDPNNNTVTFNKASTTASKVTLDALGNPTQLDVKIPQGATTGIIKVTVKSQTLALPDTFYIVRNKYVWTQLNAFPGGPRSYAVAFTVNGNSYVGTGMNHLPNNTYTGYNDLWEYNPANDTWTKKGDVPSLYGDYRANGFSFVIGNYAYVGGGISAIKSIGGKDVNKYDPLADKWTIENGATGSDSFDWCFAGTYQNKGMIFSMADIGAALYQFDPATNSLTHTVFDITLGGAGGSVYSWCASSPTQIIGGSGFSMDIIYPAGLDTKTILAPANIIEGEFVPVGSTVFRQALYFNNNVYMSFGDEGNLARFDMNEKLWFSVTKQTLGVGQGAVWFNIGSKIYAIGGNNGFFTSATANVWMLDLGPYIY